MCALVVLALIAPVVDAFCESKHGGMFYYQGDGHTVEIGNTITALMVAYVAVHVLLCWRVKILLLKLIMGLFVVNSIGSVGYHSTRDSRLGRMDFDSMLLASWIVLCVFAEELAECCLRRTVLKTVHRVSAADRVGAADALGDATELNRYVLGYEVALQRRALLKGNHRVSPSADALEEAIGLDVVSLTREERRLVTLERITRFCLTLVWSASLFIAFYFICDAPGIKDEKGKPLDHGKSKPIWYDALFISPLLVTVLGMWIMFRCIGIDYTDNNEGDVKRAMRRFGLGNVLAIISVLCQVLNEKFCSDNEFWKRFPGHAIWHVGMAYGLFQCLIILVVLHANNVRAKTVWYADLPVVKASRWKRWYFIVFPGLTYVAEGSLSEGRRGKSPEPGVA